MKINLKKLKEYNIGEPSICSALFNRELLDKNKKEIDRFVFCSKDSNIYNSSFKLLKEVNYLILFYILLTTKIYYLMNNGLKEKI